MVRGDATATAHNVASSETLFRLGIAADLVGQAFFVLVSLALYQLFKGVHRRHALVMLALILTSIPIAFLNDVNGLAALTLIHGAPFLSVSMKRSASPSPGCSLICAAPGLTWPASSEVSGSFL